MLKTIWFMWMVYTPCYYSTIGNAFYLFGGGWSKHLLDFGHVISMHKKNYEHSKLTKYVSCKLKVIGQDTNMLYL